MTVKVLYLTGLVLCAFALGSSGDSSRSTDLNEKCESNGDCDEAKDETTSADQTSLRSHFDSRFQLENELMQLKLEASVLKMRKEMMRIAHCPGFVSAYNCFYLIVDSKAALSLDYFDAKALCESDGLSSLANIYSKSHYQKILHHVDDHKGDTPLRAIGFWTAMKRDLLSGRMLLSDGTPVDYTVRSSLWDPKDIRGDEYVYVVAWVDGASHDDPGGFGNTKPSFKWNAALCQYPIIAADE